MVMPFCAKTGALKGNPFHWAAAGDTNAPRPRQIRRKRGFMVVASSADLRDELERAGVVGRGVAQRVLQLPADPVHASVVARGRAAGPACGRVGPRGAAV